MSSIRVLHNFFLYMYCSTYVGRHNIKFFFFRISEIYIIYLVIISVFVEQKKYKTFIVYQTTARSTLNIVSTHDNIIIYIL